MPEADYYSIFLPRLNDAGIVYMVTGSMACIIYGQPRMTHDIDLVIALDVHKADLFSTLFPSELFYCPPIDIVKTELLRETRGHFNLIHHQTGFKADIYPAGRDKLMAWGLANRKKYQVSDTAIWTAPPEYVIVQKLQYYREGRSSKHLSDISGVLDVFGEWIEMDQLKHLMADHGLEEYWQFIVSREQSGNDLKKTF
jgi:hypothetical protein